MAGISSYRDLLAWKQAMELGKECYRVTARFPRTETFGLVSQIRRAATSIPANIAEGYGRENTGYYIQFLRTAQGSLKELETHLLMAEGVGLAELEHVRPALEQCESVGKLLRLLIRSLQERHRDQG